MSVTWDDFESHVKQMGLLAIHCSTTHWQAVLGDDAIVNYWPTTGKYHVAGTYEKSKIGTVDDVIRAAFEHIPFKGDGMDINQAFPSKYLKASDLNGNEVNAVMDRVEMAEFDDGEPKPAVHFKNASKAFVLNKTNANTIVDIYGPNTDNWTGKPITLYPTYTDFQGRQVACVRVKPMPRHQSVQTPQPAAQPEPQWAPPANAPEDEVPF